MSERAGLLVRAGGELGFLPAALAKSVVQLPPVSPVASTPLSMALVNGRVVPVVALGSPTGVLVLCELDDEAIGFSGLEVSSVGAFETAVAITVQRSPTAWLAATVRRSTRRLSGSGS